jgi:hypothetical protein
LGEFANHLFELYKHNQTHEFIAVFATIERLHKEGDEFVKEAATIGLLEGIQNIAGYQANKFELYLGPESERWRKKLDDFWEGKQKIE